MIELTEIYSLTHGMILLAKMVIALTCGIIVGHILRIMKDMPYKGRPTLSLAPMRYMDYRINNFSPEDVENQREDINKLIAKISPAKPIFKVIKTKTLDNGSRHMTAMYKGRKVSTFIPKDLNIWEIEAWYLNSTVK